MNTILKWGNNIISLWNNNDPISILVTAIAFSSYGILSLPKAMKRYGNQLLFTREGWRNLKKSKDKNNSFDAMDASTYTVISQLCVGFGVLSFFAFFNLVLLGGYIGFIVPIIYSIILFKYYFRWTDKGYKFQEEEQKKKEEKERKKKEEDEARRNKYL
ncbi:MAG TPA: hypothetical protein VNG53_11760 [Bacteroidia bacterium]|nr:hypothetical protein [Bacteroidia bacterium]